MFRAFLHIFLILELTKKLIFWKNKRVLVLGGSSGLGLEIAKILKEKQANVTIAARTISTLKNLKDMHQFDILQIDLNDETVEIGEPNYDFIFCCVGNCRPKYFLDQEKNDISEFINANYVSTCRIFRSFVIKSKSPFTFIFIASSLALFTFPGYSSYSPTKAAISSFFESLIYEFKNVTLKIYYPSTIFTPGFERENITKPELTRTFESVSYGKSCEPRNRAISLLRQMQFRNRISSDTLTYFSIINQQCETVYDLFLLPLAVICNQIARIAVRFHFNDVESDRKG